MTHQDVVNGGIVDLYVARALAPDTAAEFEEHFFECDACFEAVHAADAMRAGVRHLSAAGELPLEVRAAIATTTRAAMPRWIPYAAAAAVAGIAIWLPYSRALQLERRLAESEQRATSLASELEQARSVPPPVVIEEADAEANIPVAVLQSTRSSDAPVPVTIPAGAMRFLLWIDGAAAQDRDLEVVLVAADGTAVARAAGVRPNSDGALVISFATRLVRDGVYTVQQRVHGRVAAAHSIRISRRN